MKTHIFRQLKPGKIVFDTWYGKGKVIKKTARRALIKLESQDTSWNYDVEHIENFIRLRRTW